MGRYPTPLNHGVRSRGNVHPAPSRIEEPRMLSHHGASMFRSRKNPSRGDGHRRLETVDRDAAVEGEQFLAGIGRIDRLVVAIADRNEP